MGVSDRAHYKSTPAEGTEQRDKLVIALMFLIVAVYMTIGGVLYFLIAALR